MHFSKILVTTDFSEDSEKAFDTAALEAKMQGSEVTLLSIVPDWDVPPQFMHEIANPEAIAAYREDLKKKAEKHLEEYKGSKFHEVKVEIQAIMTQESIADEICKFAKDNSHDLIVIGSHGRGALGRMLLGSTVTKVLQQAHCPVLVIPKSGE